MGLIRNALGSALGADKVQNGFNGPKLPFGGGPSQASTTRTGDWVQADINHDQRMGSKNNSMTRACPARNHEYSASHSYPPLYSDAACISGRGETDCSQGFDGEELPNFRPFALPQIEYGDGQPFLRGYTDQLAYHGIPESQFVEIVDHINAAVIPNPEVQIFQKGANIAGWFIPGSASLGLMAGQFAVGIGAAFGHASAVAKVLSKANIDTFLPKGLEICIGKTKDVMAEAGMPNSSRPDQQAAWGISPQDRLAMFGASLAPLSRVLSPQDRPGRKDPIAVLGRGIGNRDTKRKVDRAHRRMEKGKNKGIDSLEDSIKWLMVRKATPEGLAHWQAVLEQIQEPGKEYTCDSR